MTRYNQFRPGAAVLVTAAFIGPGTVMTASRAGAQFGFSLIWTILFAVVAAIVLQEMAARLGIVSGHGLAEAIRSSCRNKFARWLAIGLVLCAILFGNCAYQTGNILGAAAGLEVLTSAGGTVWAILIATIAAVIILIGRFAVLQWMLTIMVAIMGVIFIVSAVLCGPDLLEIAHGFKPSVPENSGWVIVGLIGTTIVPYNLFLHASAAAKHFESLSDDGAGDVPTAVRHSMLDTILSISVGGIITAALLITAAVTFADKTPGTVGDIAQQLRPSLGVWAERTFAIGLFAAGLTSALTAPIAAAYATAGCFGWEANLSNVRLKIVAIGVVAIGLAFAIRFGSSPQETIIIAQAANGLLLPIVAAFLLYTLNRSELLGKQTNGWIANILGISILAVTAIIAFQKFHGVWAKLVQMFIAD